MKKGQIVKFIKHRNVCAPSCLTTGKEYTVCSGQGDPDMFGDYVRHPDSFEVVGDNGHVVFCRLIDCAHGVWEVLSDA